MAYRDWARRCGYALPALVMLAVTAAPGANADPPGVAVPGNNQYGNARLNNSIAENVYTIQQQAGCTTDLKISPQLRQAAQWQADDVLNNRDLDGDIGSDGSTVQSRANAAGYQGVASETVMINPALAVSAIEVMNNWYYRPDYMAIMSNCANTQIGVWSDSQLDRTVLVAVYGIPA